MAALSDSPQKGDVGMTRMSLEAKIDALSELGGYIKEFDERLHAHMNRAFHTNPWFTIENQRYALNEIAEQFLDKDRLMSWANSYEINSSHSTNVGVISAGNIPLVGFHDVLSVFMSDNVAQIKLSERDPYLMSFLLKKLEEIDPSTADYFEIANRLSGFEAVIATGSNNSARYFEQYFGKYPNIIRKNRNGVAVLNGKESVENLVSLGQDIFRYFGLGCRNVSHVYIPEDYDFDAMNNAFSEYSDIANHTKYRNNFDHNLAIFILNRFPHININSVLLAEDDRIISPIGCLYYSKYRDIDDLELQLKRESGNIQCVVSNIEFTGLPAVTFGEAQRPSLSDYADGVDTMQFLTSL